MERRIIASFVLLFTLLAQLNSVGQETTKPMEFVVQKVLERAQENELHKRERLTYQRVNVVEALDSSERPTHKKKEETIQIERGGRERIVVNGRVTNQSVSKNLQFDLIKALEAMAKFDEFEMVRIDMINNRPYYLITFKPKAKPPRAATDLEQIILRSQGWMYVDLEKFYIKQITVWMTRSYSRAMGIFNLSRANMEMVQEEFEGVVVLKTVTVIDKYSVFGIDTFERQNWTYQNYRLAVTTEEP